MGILTKNIVLSVVLFSACSSYSQSGKEKAVWLSDLDLSKMSCVMGMPRIRESIKGEPMQIAGEKFVEGVGTHAYSSMLIDLHGSGKMFSARVGLDDGAYVYANVSFFVVGDKKLLWSSGPVKKGEKARVVEVDLTGVQKLGLLVMVNREDISENYADWAKARIVYKGERPNALDNRVRAKQWGILTPTAPRKPLINAPPLYGVGPGSPVLYRVPATGERPMQFGALQLPPGLQIDSTTGIITGVISKAGRYPVVITAKNKFGHASKKLTIVAGDRLALTPPMGWNSWYIYYQHVSDSAIRRAANNMILSGMADYGYQYVNIDDGWANKPGSSDGQENGPARDSAGRLMGNQRFPDMEALTAYIHSKGLKAGIYSSPGPKTCAGYAGSYLHEVKDAKRFAAWGFDFLKYDWCSYGSVVKGRSLDDLKAPFISMGAALKNTDRDIVFNLCQYGMGDVWKWGASVGNSWRTGPDLGTSTGSFMPGFYTVALRNTEYQQYGGPGGWNDPDYINIGWIGTSGVKGKEKRTAYTANEQYAYMSLWSLMAAPLFFSGDMNRLDLFTRNILCNAEVIAVDQDERGKQAKIIRNDANGMIMVKELADGTMAVGLFNYPGNKSNPIDYFVWDNQDNGTREISVTASELGLQGKFSVRDLWRQKDLGVFENSFRSAVPYHGVMLIRISQ